MPLSVQVQTNFTTGEVSPKASGRSDLRRYFGALALCENIILPKQGNAERRTGTRYVAEVKNSDDLTILHPFRASTIANYIIELGDLYSRFYTERGQLLDGASAPVELVTPWTTDELRDLKFTQSNDVLYAFHPDYETRETRRTSATQFQIRALGAENGPYQARNTTKTVLVSSGVTGSVTIDSEDGSGNPFVAGINDSLGFLETDVGRQIRWIESTGAETWLTITAVALTVDIASTNAANPVQVTTVAPHVYATGEYIHIKDTDNDNLNDLTYKITSTGGSTFTLDGIDGGVVGSSTGGTARRATKIVADFEGNDIGAGQQTRRSWALGSFSDTTGYPRCGAIHQQRLYLAGTPTEPQTVWGSVTGVYDDFSPAESDGTVLDDNSITFTVDANLVMNIYDMKSHARGLMIMTDEAEVVASVADNSFTPMTPSNNGARIQSNHGINPQVRAEVIDNTVVFVQDSSRKVLATQFRFEADMFVAEDLTKLAEHIGGQGFVDIAYQRQPDEILWLVRSDGQLVGMTYDPKEQVFGWHRHIIGGNYKGDDSVVESCAVVRDTPDDLLWIIVKRTIDGSDVRYVEYVGDRFETEDEAEEAFFVDSGIGNDYNSIDGNICTISNISKGNPTTITGTSGGIIERVITGETWHIRDVEGMTDINNDTTGYVVTGSTGSFTIPVDSTSWDDYTTGGIARKVFSTVSGLDHLEGETVKVAGDGEELDDEVVSSGAITLSDPSSIIYVGLPSPYQIVTMPIVAASAGFDTRTSLLSAVKANVMLDNSQSGTFGVFNGTSYDIEYDDTELFTGIKEVGIEGASDWRFQLVLASTGIYPMNVLQLGLEVSIGS